jgi:adenylate kinase
MLNFIFFGPPGAGKGTQAKLISEEFDLIHLSTGEILRSAIQRQTPLGQQAKQYVDKGELVPDDIIIGMIRNRLKSYDNPKGFIFDGFPRTIKQAQAFDQMLAQINSEVTAVIRIKVTDEEVLKRLINRAKIEGRTDDTPEVISRRLEVYRKNTEPLIDFYRSQNKLYEVDGLGSIEEVNERIKQVISRFL